jgi:hypothetical protein
MKPLDRYHLPAVTKAHRTNRVRERLTNYLGEPKKQAGKRSAAPLLLLVCLAALLYLTRHLWLHS